MAGQNNLTVAHADRYYLNFPKQEPPVPIGLRKISGRLQGSVRASEPVIIGDRVESAIGSNVVYAAVHEFGYQGPQEVPAHTRAVKSRNVYRIGERADLRKSKLSATGVALVKAFTREVNIPARAPIQSAIEDRADDYGKAISAEVAKAWEGTQ